MKVRWGGGPARDQRRRMESLIRLLRLAASALMTVIPITTMTAVSAPKKINMSVYIRQL